MKGAYVALYKNYLPILKASRKTETNNCILCMINPPTIVVSMKLRAMQYFQISKILRNTKTRYYWKRKRRLFFVNFIIIHALLHLLHRVSKVTETIHPCETTVDIWLSALWNFVYTGMCTQTFKITFCR